jgi:Tol biopolymer transport system component
VFESEGNLFIADWNGANVIQVPSDPGSENSPRWSPDGSKIAFIFGSDVEPAQVRIYDLETGQGVRVLNKIHAPNSIYWLPGGEMAVVSKVSQTDWTELINIVGADGTVIRQLPENAKDYTYIGGLSFSPDLQQLAFVGDIVPTIGKTMIDIYLTNVNGNSVINLTKGLGYNFDPAWLPLGDWLAFASNRTGDWNVYLIKPDGSHLTQVTRTSSDEGYPAWRINH